MGYKKENGFNEKADLGIGRGGSHMKKKAGSTFNKRETNKMQNKQKKRGKNNEV